MDKCPLCNGKSIEKRITDLHGANIMVTYDCGTIIHEVNLGNPPYIKYFNKCYEKLL